MRWPGDCKANAPAGDPQAKARFPLKDAGDPDGKIATLSRPSSPGNLETESADDFILATNTLLYQATFTGLIPAGASA